MKDLWNEDFAGLGTQIPCGDDNKKGKGEKQIPYGDDRKKCKGEKQKAAPKRSPF